MPSADSPALIVARYLKSNNYTQTYEAFIAEAGLPYDAGNVTKGDLDLETLLDEKKNFDIAVKFEKLGVEDANTGWKQPAPTIAKEIDVLPSTSNILSTNVEDFVDEDGSVDEKRRNKSPLMLLRNTQQLLLATTADKRINLLNAGDNTLRTSLSSVHDAPALSTCRLFDNLLLSASMSGQLHLSNLSGKTISQRRDHNKYIVKIATVTHPLRNETIIATAGWDNKVTLYNLPSNDDPPTPPSLPEPFATIPLQTKPEAILFVRHPSNNEPILLLSRTDSNNIFYYSISTPTPRLLGQQNLAPHSNAWVAFTPSSLELCPTDRTLLAVGTSSIPHMKLLIVRLLFPSGDFERSDPQQEGETQLIQSRRALLVAERESAAIQIHATTMAPQTAYSTPAVAWRPDGSGVWVNGDDGAVRGIEASTGKVVCTLRENGHEPGSKVRCLWAGMVRGGAGDGGDGGLQEEREVVVSGGFDRKLIVWGV
ncbi:hypothetical protein CERZMDRAFT_89147 [Cercospora zeae-maydis SCOH1-5]|uniref:PAC1-like LisH-like dimerisation domain-containing protein n=1 Tax=Cercospora zeae-maydis SCOH1-5 TaxID=717836 RepID=A0A6A6F2W4_9PEZI|nr:hypothetical protein CERZMDRAFT_89147 [Cercospora zeae-maydis SCOH1-5]